MLTRTSGWNNSGDAGDFRRISYMWWCNYDVASLLQVIDLDQEKFLTADVNGDAVLDLEEYTAFMHPYDFPHMHHVEIKRVLRKYDKNNDGVIDLPEFMQEEDFRKWYINAFSVKDFRQWYKYIQCITFP